MSVILVHSSCPSEAVGREIGKVLVKRQLAACVSILPIAASIYQWEGELEEAAECLLLIKSDQQRLELLEQTLIELHPYETPEFLVTQVAHASEGYRLWLNKSLGLPL